MTMVAENALTPVAPDVQEQELARDISLARTALATLFAQQEGCVSARTLRKQLDAVGVKDVEGTILRLRGAEAWVTEGAKIFWRGRSFYTEEAYLQVQEKAADDAVEAVEEAQSPVGEDESDSVVTLGAPKLKENRKEEARLVTYVHGALEMIYASRFCPDVEYVFDVHNDRPGSEYENVDLLAVHWRGEKLAELVTVEVKLGFTAKLVQQASNYRRFSDRVWIAVPVEAALSDAAAWLREQNGRLFDLVVDLGIGILACRRGKGRSYEVLPVHWPAAITPNRIERQDFLERHRRQLEEARIVPPRDSRSYPAF
jgi:hypothetical protein